jgi:hypothetical protein
MDRNAHPCRKGQLRNLKLVCLAEIWPAEPIKRRNVAIGQQKLPTPDFSHCFLFE